MKVVKKKKALTVTVELDATDIALITRALREDHTRTDDNPDVDENCDLFSAFDDICVDNGIGY